MASERLGVFLCTCDKKLNLDFKGIAKDLKSRAKFVEIVDRLCTPEGRGYIAQHLRWKDERRPSSIVIAACNSKNRVFAKLMEEYNFSSKNMVIENIREHCAWVHSAGLHSDRAKATEKAKAIVKEAAVRAKYAKKCKPLKPKINQNIALIGFRPGAEKLREFGAALHVVEKEGYIKRQPALASSDEFSFYPSSEIIEKKGKLGDYTLTLKRGKFIYLQKCISCGKCVAACPRKAICSPEDALFHSYVIGEECDSCGACLKVCSVDAINLKEKNEEIKVGQVISFSGEEPHAALLRAALNLSGIERESPIRADLRKCANMLLKEKKLDIIGCAYCNAACAYGAISCGEVDELSCRGCGICASACPQGAPELCAMPEEETFLRIEAALDTKLSPKVLVFSCTEFEYSAAAVLHVPCTGAVSEAHILRAFELGCDGVLLLSCDSGKCRYKNGIREAAKTVALARQVLDALGTGKERVKIFNASEKFAAIKDFVENLKPLPARLMNKKPAEINELLKEGKSRREILLRIVQNLSKTGIKSGVIRDYAFGDIIVDETKCTLCGACASICATGALVSTPEDLPRITFTHAYCITCGICEKICPEKVLRVEKMFDIERFVSATPEEINVELVKCKNCSKPLMAATAYKKLSSMLEKEKAEFLLLCKGCRDAKFYSCIQDRAL